MENLYFAVIPAQAGIQWLQELRDPRLRGDDGFFGDDGKLVFFDTLLWGEGQDEGELLCHPHSPPSRGQALALSLKRVPKNASFPSSLRRQGSPST